MKTLLAVIALCLAASQASAFDNTYRVTPKLDGGYDVRPSCWPYCDHTLDGSNPHANDSTTVTPSPGGGYDIRPSCYPYCSDD